MTTIQVSPGEMGTHNWTLIVGRRQFFLGQDIKFCRRVLGQDPKYIGEMIGGTDLRNAETRQRLGRYILSQLDLTDDDIKELQPWSLCCQ